MSNAQKHWEKTRSLLFVTLAIWFVFSIGIFLFAAEMNEVLDLSVSMDVLVYVSGSLGIS